MLSLLEHLVPLITVTAVSIVTVQVCSQKLLLDVVSVVYTCMVCTLYPIRINLYHESSLGITAKFQQSHWSKLILRYAHMHV